MFRLLAITPGDHGRGRDLRAWLRALGEAGLPAALIREPHLDEPALAAVAEEAARFVPQVILHDRNPHARALGWPLHLRAGAAPPGRPFGVSCHDAAALDRAFAAGAAWALLSPVWAPTSKPDDARPPLGLQRFLALAGDRPVLALGGVDPGRLRELRRAGGHGGAVLGGLFGQPTIGRAADALGGLLAAL